MFINEFEVIQESPFKYDKLNRQGEIEKLTRLFEVVGNQMVLAIDSPWGTGKSTFLNMWNCHLRNKGYKTIFFNAWQNDFMEEPFIAFVSSIREELIEQDKKKAFTERAQKVGTMLLKQSPKILTKVVEKHTGVDISEEIDIDGIESFIGKQIDNYQSNRNSLEKFKEELSKHTQDEIDRTGNPIVIFIDELDRCRPNYAISLMERIKHIFNVPNIIFVLGIDKEALSNSIKVIYGNGTDINGYLSRFIDMEYTLNETAKKNYIEHLLIKYGFQSLIEQVYNTNRDTMEYSDFCELIQEIITNFNISLRDAEKILTNIYITLNTSKVSSNLMCAYIFMSVLRKVDNESYRMVKERKITTKELIEKFDRNNILSEWINEPYGNGIFLKGQLMWLLNEEDEIRVLEEVCRNKESQDIYIQKRLLEIIKRNKSYKPNGFDERDTRKVLSQLAIQIEMYNGLDKL